jgi:hypothetical protein
MDMTQAASARSLTVAGAATVHVRIRYFSYDSKGLFLPGCHGKPRKARCAGLRRD